MNKSTGLIVILLVIALVSICVDAIETFDDSLKTECREVWSRVFGPAARDGASWNSEWDGNVTEETCGPYFEEFEREAEHGG